MYKILTLNNISVAGLDHLPRDSYEVASEVQHPDGVLLRSFKMHDMDLPDTVNAIGRAGAGVNNIPVDDYSKKGVAVFNAPGANANAVKELVITGMLLACRNICQSWDFSKGLEGEDDVITKQVEAGKKNFVGFELPGRTLGVVGLGAIGVKVANVAIALGMNVIGYDPTITVGRAWQLSSEIEQANSIDELMSKVDFVTFHVPLTEETRHLVNPSRIRNMKDNAVILNFARNGIVDDDAVCEALDDGKLYAYVCDFPSNLLKKHPRVITLPHLGASTKEAEENCAIMVAKQVKDYLENGNVKNSVNFPEVSLPRNSGRRITVVNENIPNMVGQISTDLANANLNIIDLMNKSRGDLAYTIIDVENDVPDETVQAIKNIEGVLKVRVL
ncbi:MAG: phosphoglycerate dehydrogenase [Methylococcales bacterium]|nr:phosphoglycerate dehydrogenase [Methylococcales bacterium]MBT7410599.1 phosphoglycerate dehydrogenase [Methylococcales bacterium]